MRCNVNIFCGDAPVVVANCIVENARDEADAIKQAESIVSMPPGRRCEVEWLESLPLIDTAAKVADVEPDTPIDPEPAIVPAQSESPAVLHDPQPAVAPPTLEELQNYGLTPNDARDLEAAGLSDAAEIVAYARNNGGLTNIKGVGDVSERRIKAAINAYREANS